MLKQNIIIKINKVVKPFYTPTNQTHKSLVYTVGNLTYKTSVLKQHVQNIYQRKKPLLLIDVSIYFVIYCVGSKTLENIFSLFILLKTSDMVRNPLHKK